MQRGLVGSEMCIRDRYMGEMKSLQYQTDQIKILMESKLEKERAKNESKPLQQELRRVKEKYTQHKISSIRDKKESQNQIAILNANNQRLSETLKELQEQTNIVRMTTTIQQLRLELHTAQEMLKKEKEDKSNTGFKLYTLLEASKRDIKEKDSALFKKSQEYSDLLEKYNATVKELGQIRTTMKINNENMKMTAEDIAGIKFRMLKKRK
eukprot:TRINITY_DN9105_c0_g1_i1.p1 TRINITY_DN9105_c0_g1~~TRINITY_DN9105_c0_g1_i1.p1  ORF type:complete len:210 (+),score=55.34 TRINITY_DN9105_c0_g1_i1:125-754(+)